MTPFGANELLSGSAYWQLVPLVLVVSIVYSATRHEEWSLIWRRSVRLSVFIFVFMSVSLSILWAIQLL